MAGVPDNPEAWLLTVARNRLRDVLGSAAARTSTPLELADRRLVVVISDDFTGAGRSDLT